MESGPKLTAQEMGDVEVPIEGWLTIKNRPFDHSNARAEHIVSPDALALMRVGLRAADDPRILNTLRVIDTVIHPVPLSKRANCIALHGLAL